MHTTKLGIRVGIVVLGMALWTSACRPQAMEESSSQTLESSSAAAPKTGKDLGFRFRGGKCVRVALEDGGQRQVLEEGYNPEYTGECGDFRGKTLKLNLNNADLTGANFEGADLTGSNFRHAKLGMANFNHARLGAVNFERADLVSASFIEADLVAPPSKHSFAPKTSFKDADVRFADFTNAILSGATLFSANFGRANLMGAVAQKVDATVTDFTGANLAGADFTDATLMNTEFVNTFINQFTKIKQKGWLGSLGEFVPVDAHALP